MNNRRSFLKRVSLGAVGLTMFNHKLLAQEDLIKITILHTNDMHSRIEPFSSGKFKGFGGMAQRSSIIEEIRKKEIILKLISYCAILAIILLYI